MILIGSIFKETRLKETDGIFLRSGSSFQGSSHSATNKYYFPVPKREINLQQRQSIDKLKYEMKILCSHQRSDEQYQPKESGFPDNLTKIEMNEWIEKL